MREEIEGKKSELKWNKFEQSILTASQIENKNLHTRKMM